MSVSRAIIYKTRIPVVDIPGLGVTLVHDDGTTSEAGPYAQYGVAFEAAVDQAGTGNVFYRENSRNMVPIPSRWVL